MSPIEFFILLMFAHAVADFGLQSETMAHKKVRKEDIKTAEICGWEFRGGKYQLTWYYWLAAHGLIHGAMVYLFTGAMWMAIAEFILHTLIDVLKCEGKTDIHQDQIFHMICKVVYTATFFLIS